MANEFPATSHFMDGVLRCSRYAFGPNRLHYCGPDANCEIHSYINESASDPGLRQLLREFQTMFPYLRHIADVNGIPDPFDERVVEAYWLGNELLEKINAHAFYRHLIEDQRIRDKIGAKSFELVAQKIGQGAVPHHSFHVFDVWKRAGRADHEHTLEWMDECRISWGTVLTVDGPTLTVLTEPLTLTQGKFALGNPMERKLVRT